VLCGYQTTRADSLWRLAAACLVSGPGDQDCADNHCFGCQKHTIAIDYAGQYVGPHMGDHVCLPPNTRGTGDLMKQNGDGSAAPPVYTSSERIAVPANAVELLRESIRLRRDGAIITEKMREAIVLICIEARRSEVMPEHLLVAVKELCHALPEYEKISGARERDAFIDAVVKVSIEEFYRDGANGS
jgi:hypothetical protein